MKSSYHHYNGYVIRKPAFSYDILFATDNITKDLDELVVELIDDKSFLNAIFWSSPDLYRAIEQYKRRIMKEEQKIKVFSSLKKYLLRGCTRSTPYGALSGCAFVRYKGNEVSNANHKARIDMGLLEKIKVVMENDVHVKYHLKYTLNNTLYKKGNYIKFLEQKWNDNKKNFELSLIENTDYIKDICERFQNKFIPISELKNTIAKDFDDNEIHEFTEALLGSGLLISELEIIFTSSNHVGDVLNTLRRLQKEEISQIGIYISICEKVQYCIEFIDNTLHDLPLKEINEIEQLIGELNIHTNQIFHVDLRVANNNKDNVDESIIKNLSEAVDFLQKITPRNLEANKDLKQFKELFKTRFESQEIPLTEVLDSSCGIGFPVGNSIGNDYESRIFDIDNSNKNLKKNDEFVSIEWLSDKIESAGANAIIELTTEDIKDKSSDLINLSYNFSVVGSYCQNKGFFLQSVTNGSALSLIGRFAYLDAEIEKLCECIAQDEIKHETDAILAEILFLPEGRVGNICRHPSFYEYEIPIITESELPVKNQIHVDDLMVSVVNNEIILRSKALNKRVIPRLSNAHNFNSSPVALYRFLSSLQYQSFPAFGLRFNYIKNKKGFFPRIVYKNIILHRATWILSDNDIKTILRATKPQAELSYVIKARKITRFVVLVEHDNELFLDLENESFQNLLIEELKRSFSFVQLTEWIYDAVLGANISQFVIPLKNTSCQPTQNPPASQPDNLIIRSFPPGSEWLYLKIYCSAFISDDVLVALSAILVDLKGKAVISEHFFIRYMDPHYHLRLRIKFNDLRFLPEILQLIQQQLRSFLEEGTIWKTSIDTYEREVERYGAFYIEDTERLFYYDTKLVLHLLHQENFREDEISRAILAVLNIDNYLSTFNLTLKEKISFCKKMEFAFEKEFNGQNKKYLYNKYRDFGSNLYSCYHENFLNDIFQIRTKKISLLKLSKSSLSDYVHMSINRWFPGQQRFYEYMCYIFAAKLYNRLLNEENV